MPRCSLPFTICLSGVVSRSDDVIYATLSRERDIDDVIGTFLGISLGRFHYAFILLHLQ